MRSRDTSLQRNAATIARRPAPLSESARSGWLTAERFVGISFMVCLLLQRISVPYGDLEVSVSTPVVLVLSLWALGDGVLTIDRERAAFFLGLFACGLVAWAVHENDPLAIAPRTSLNSLVYWLAMTAFAVFRLREPMEEVRFFRIFTAVLDIVAVAGLIEFLLQFFGFRFFSFTGFIPSHFLIEREYDVVAPIPGTHFLRSNGFFLVEPSVFSQFLALGIIIEFLFFHRASRLALYFAGLFASVSGTGWLVLGTFMIEQLLTGALSKRNALRALALVLAAFVALVVTNFVMPDIVGVMRDRIGEISSHGSSAYQRFVTPFLAAEHVFAADPWSLVTGIGPGASSHLIIPFHYQLNTPVKVGLEYGLLGLLFYLLLLFDAVRTPGQWLLFLPLMVMLMFTGGYQEFSPILFPVLLIGTVALLRRSDALPTAL